MIKKLLLLVFGLSAISLAAPAPALAYDPFGGVDCGSGNTEQSAACNARLRRDQNPLIGKDGIIVKATDIVAYVAGAAAIILLIVSGIQYVTSDGDSNKTGTAKRTIINALIGLIVIVLARSLIIFVLDKF